MIDLGKQNVLGVMVDAVDYEAAVARILAAARTRVPYSCTALAVHGVMTGVLDGEQRHRLNALDLVTPDGQPVRWGINALHRSRLPERVYGPTLMLHVCAEAARAKLPIYLHGGQAEVVETLSRNLEAKFPDLEIAGSAPSAFRRLSEEEGRSLTRRIRSSGAALVFVGLGCPRQEVFAYEYADGLGMPVIAVGAAFDYHAGVMREPSAIVQRLGLQWAHRLAQDPRRLWKRYLGLNLLYLALIALQRTHAWRPALNGVAPEKDLRYG